MLRRHRRSSLDALAVALTAFAMPAVPVSAASPTVDAVKFLSSPQSGDTYGVGERITVEVKWNESVTVTGSPRLALTMGSKTLYAEYAGGVNPRFRYTVGSRVRDLNGVSVAAGALELNGGAIRSESTNENADIGLGSHAITDDSSHKVDGSIAVAAIVTAVRITTRPSGGRAYFRTGERIRVEVRFGKPVSASSIVRPRLALSIGAATRQVSAAASSGFSEFLTFDYTVQSGDYDPDGFSIAAGALTLGRVVDRGARAANLNLGRHAISSAAGYRVNNAPPSFGSATVANRKFDTDTPIAPLVLPEATGEGTLSYTLTPSTMPQGLTWTSATRTISGTPTAVTAARTYTWKATDSEDETATLTFTIAVAEIPSFGSAAGPALRYEVNQPIASFSLPAAAGGDGALTYALGTTPALPEGLSYTPPTGTATGGVIAGTPTEAKAERTYTLTATDTDGDAATFTFTISVVNHPVVSEVRIMDWSTNGVYYSGEEIRIFVGFSSSITVWGNTDLAIVIGGQTRRAGRHSFNTTGLWYSYTVQDSDFDTDGISIPADAHRLTSGVIQRTGTGQSVDMAIGGLAITDAPDHKVGSPRFATGASVPAQSYTQRTLIDSLTLPSATGATPLTYALGATPALPAGLTYTAPTSGNSHGGVIAGTPTAALAQTTYTFTATDTNGRSDSLTFTITVDGIPTFGDATVANQSWVQRRRIAAFTLPAAVGGDGVLTYALSPSLPGGVTRDAATHVVSGAPSTSQTATTYTWAATDADGDKAELAFTIEVEGVPAVTLATADSAIAENGGTTTVTATLSHAWGQAMTVTVTPVAGSYTVGQDAAIAIAAGSTANASDSVTITAVNDDLDNVGDRSVTVSGTAGSARGAGSVTGAPLTLTDDEATPTATLVLSPASIAEGAWATVAATLDRASSEAVTLTVSAAAGANASDGDFTLSSTRTLAIAAGSTSSSGTVTITATRDASNSPDKEVTVSASVSGSSGVAAPASRTLTITDDGPPTVTLALADSSISENGGTTTVSATLTSAWTSEIVVTLSGLAGVYAVGADTTIAIPAGQTQNSSDTVTVTAVDNATDAPDRSVTVAATAEYLAPGSLTRSVGVSGAVLTLEDDDAAPYVTVQPSTLRISENGGTADLSATSSHPSSAVTKVTISVARSSRAPAGDYVLSRNRVLTIAAGATTSTGTVTVAAVDNDRDEPDRWVVLRGTPQNSQGTNQYAGLSLAIDDDEAAPAVTLAVADGAVDEDGGTTTVTATLSHASSEATTITVTALDGAYTVGTDATIVIAAGATSNASDTAAITAVDDDVDNVGNRTVTVTATADNDHGIGAVGGASLTLTDDEETPAVTLALSEPDTSKPDTIAESGSGNASTVTATLSGPSSEAVTLTVATAPGANTVEDDFTLSSAKTLTIAAGATASAGTVTVTAVDDTKDAPDKSVTVSAAVSGASGVAAPADATLTITDDDDPPAVSISSPSVSEGAAGTTATLRFEVTLGTASGRQVTVDYTESATGRTATPGTDYTALASGTLTIAAGDTSGVVAVTVVGDGTDEPDEQVKVVLSGPVNATLGTATGTGTITDDDAAPAVTLAVADGAVDEDGGTTTVTATLSHASSEDTTITVTALDGAYTVGTDATIVIAAGATSNASDTAAITAVDDDVDNVGNRTVTVTATAVNSHDIGTVTGASLTLTDDEETPAVTLALSEPDTSKPDTIAESGSGNASTVTATLSGPSSEAVTLTVAAAPGANAVEGDFTLSPAKTLTIAAGSTASTGAVTVTAVDDTKDAPDKEVTVTATVSGTSGVAAPSSVTLTITDDDDAPGLSIDSPRVDEGDSGSVSLEFTVSLSAASGRQVTVGYAEGTGGTATAGTDYTAISAGTLTFAAGETAKTLTVSVTGDTTDEPDETVVVSLSGAVNAAISTASGTGTITDDDATPTVTLALSEPDASKPDTVNESGAGNSSTVTASLSGRSSAEVILTVAATAGANAEAGDFTLSSAKTLTIAAGSTASAGTVTVTAVDDTKDAPDKEVTVTATVSGTSGVAAPSSVTLMITDDDDAPAVTLAVADSSVSENGGSTTVTATLSHPSSADTAITVTASAGTGAVATDFTQTGATLTVAAGATRSTGTVTVTANDDTTDAPDKEVTISGSAVNAQGVGAVTGTTLTITDDEGLPTVALVLLPSSISESGGVSTVTATLSGASSEAVTVTVGASPVTSTGAMSGDFTLSTANTLTIASGSTTSTGAVTVTAVDDTKDAPDKAVTVSGTAAGGNGVAAPSDMTLALTDDDDAPGLSISSSSVDEGDSGSASLEFTVSLGAASGRQVTVGYADAGTGTATSGTDYTAISAGTLTFAAGETAKTLTVLVTGDTTDEPDETVVVSLSGAVNAAISTASGTGTITDDDATPTVTLALSEPDASKPDTVNESGAGNSSTVTATLSGPSSAEVILTVAATAGANAEAGDFTLSSAKTLTIASGSTASAGTVTVAAVDDTKDAPDKSVTVTATVSGTSGVAAPSSVTLTITDDDDAPSLSIDSPRVDEGDSGTVSLEFTVSLGAASGRQVTVGYADAGTGTATSGTDYTAISAGTLTFAAGETAKTVTVSVTGDATDEPDETVVVSLSGSVNAAISTASGTGTITDDDATPTVTLALSEPDASKPDTVNESGAGNSSTVTATLSGRSSAEVILTVAATAGANAVAGDFALSSAKTLTIASGSTASTGAVTVTAVDDTKDAPDKSVTVTAVVSGSSGVAAPSSVTLTITDDDDAPAVTLAVVDSSVSENGGSTTVTATLSHPSSADTAITVTASAGTGAVAADFTQTGATLTVAAGATRSTGTVTVTANDDTTDAPDKEVTISGSAVNAQGVGAVTGTTLTITDDEGLPTVALVVLPSSISESGGVSTVTATLSGASSEAVTVTVGASPVTSTGAMSGDFTLSTANTLTIASGSTTSTGAVTVTAVDNAADAPDKAVTVSGTAAGGNGVAAPSDMTLALTDDDAAPEVLLSVASSSIPEKGGSTTVSATLTHPSSAATTVTVTPVANAYTVASGSDATIVIAAGSTASATDTATITAVDNAVDAADSDVTVMGTAANTQATAESETMTVTGASLTITDDDTAGFVVSPSTSASLRLRTTEDGGTAAFEVKLGSEPTGDVVLGVASSDTTEGTVSASSLTFTATTWNTAQTVTLTGVDDAPANPVDGDRSYTVTLTVNRESTADAIYDALSAITVYAVNADNEYGLDVGSVTGQATEAGGQATFTVALLTRPSAAVTVSVTSLDASEGAASPSSLTFTDSDWNTTQTVTVTGADDAIDDGGVTWNVRLAPSSGDANYNGLSNVDVLVTTTDDDDAPNAALSLNPSSISESGDVSTVTATLSRASSEPTTVTVTPVSGFYTVGSDAVIVIAAGETANATDTATVAAVDNATDAPDRAGTVTVTVSNDRATADGTTLAVSGGALTVTDDDAAPNAKLSLNPSSVSENGGASAVSATLTHPSSEPTTVTVTPVSGAYTVGSDATIVIAAGSTANATDTAAIAGVDNATDEPDRTATVTATLTNSQGAGTVTGATLTLEDDDDAPTLSIDSPSVAEGDSGSKDLTFTVTLSAASGQQVTVAYADATTGTAMSGTDYTAITGGTLTFTAGTTSRTFDVSVTGDVLDESNETVVVSLSSPTNATVSNTAGTGTGTITDNDATPSITLTVDDGSVGEGDGATTITVTATVDGATRFGAATTVTVSVAGSGTTTAVDFAAVTDFDIEIAAGAASNTGTFTLTPTDDTTDETDETITVSGASGSLTVNPATITLTDDDGAPTLSIDSPSVAEGDSGSKDLTFTVTLSPASGREVTVAWAEGTGGTATSGTDYTAITGGTLTFAAGTTSQTFNVSVTGDALDESNETVVVSLSTPTNAAVSNTAGTGTGTITDDDATPSITVTVDDGSVGEGDGATTITVTATVDGTTRFGAATTVTVSVAGSGTASAVDFAAVDAFDIEIAAGAASNTGSFTLTPTDDALDETDETITVSGASGGLTVNPATISLTDDDAAPTLSIDSPSVTEGDSGSKDLTFTVTLSAASGQQVTVAYADATTGTATSGTDYTAIAGGTLTFTAGTTSRTFDVSVTGDALDESNETVVVSLSSPTNAAVSNTAGTGTGTITDDDDAPTLSIDSPSVTEGDSGSKDLTFTVTLSAASGQQVTVAWADATTGTATSGTDYTAIAGGTLTFTAGTTSRTFDVSVTGDALDESNETVVVSLSTPTNATVSNTTGTGTGTITDDDDAPTLSIDSPSVAEGDSGSKDLTFTVTLSAASGQQVTVAYADATTGTATSGTDYTAIAGGTLTFTAETTSRTFNVSVTGDVLAESNETVVVALSGSVNAAISTASGTGTITDNDATPSITVTVDDGSVGEGDGATTITVTATVDGTTRFGAATTVTVSVAGSGTATAVDFAAVDAFDIEIAAGAASNTGSFTLTPTDDALDETDETITVSGASGGLTVNPATISLTDDDAAPTLSIDSPSVTEGDSGSKDLTFTVTLSAASGQQVTVAYADATTGTATSGTDYTAITGGTLTFTAGTTSRTFDVSVTGDVLAESNETVVVTLSNAGNATISTASGTGTITDNDATPSITLTVDDGSVGEGDGATTITVTATVDGTTRFGAATTVTVSVAGSGAAAAVDFAAVTDFDIEIAAGAASQTGTFTLTPTDDTTDETDETITVSGASGSLTVNPATISLTDNDATPTLSIDSPSVAEGDSGTTNLTFTVTLSAASGQQVTVAYADATTGTATSGTDYTAITGGTLTFTAGTTSRTFDVSVTGDALDESNETVVVSLSTPTNATVSNTTGTGTGTITDDDDAPTLSIDSPSVAEGDSGSKDLTFTVTLSAASGQQVTVAYADATTGTATSGTDYTAIAGGTLTFAAGTTSRTFDVSVTGDTLDESNETVVVELSSPTNAAVSNTAGTGTGTITDDDDAPTLSIDSPSVTEGDSGSKDLTFTVTLSAASGQQVTVAWADATTGTATSGTDYTAIAGGTLTFTAGTTSRTFDVSVTGDALDESNETVVVSLSTPTNATVSNTTGTGTGTITDDDDAPTLSIDSPSVAEGDSGSKDLTFTVTLSAASGQQVTVAWADATTGTATSGTDYTAIAGGTLTFTAGTTSRTFDVSVTGDTLDESNETVVVELSSPTNAAVSNTAGTGTGTITDDDDAPTLSIDSPSVTEGDSGSKDLTFTVTLSAASGQQVTVAWADATTGTATSGTDYTAIAGGTLTFTAGTTSRTFDVSVTGDALDESNETVVVSLSTPTNATVSNTTDTGTGTITDDDDAPTLSIDSPSVAEGDSGSKDLTFTVTLSAASGQQVTVAWADATTGTATSGTDYTAIAGGTLTFTAGTTSRIFDVSVTGDALDESNETVVVALSGSVNAAISTASGTGTITDDDATPTVTLALSEPDASKPDTVNESGAGNSSTVTATLSGPSSADVILTVAATAGANAVAGDFALSSAKTLTIASGSTASTGAVTVTAVDDTKDAPDKSVTVTAVVSGSSGVAAPPAVTLTITDDDATPGLSISSPRVGEGDSGTATLRFVVTLSAASGREVTVGYGLDGTDGGTATPGTDYTAISAGTLTFAAGTTSRSIDVAVRGDTTDEADETIKVTLSGATNATGAPTGTGTITDDDGEPSLSIDSPSVAEGDSGSASLEFTVSLSVASGRQVTVGYADAGTGTASSSTDYTALASGTLTFAAGETARTLTVTVTGDGTDEPDETVVVTLSGAVNAVIGTASGTGTITDDDATPTVTLALSEPDASKPDTVNESGAGNSSTVTATLSGRSSAEVILTVAATAGANAVAGDFALSSAKTLTIAAGATASTGAVTVTAVDDTKDAPDKSVTVSATVSGTSGVAAPPAVTLTITDDDGEPSLSIDSPSVAEGDSGSASLAFTVSLSAASGRQVTVGYADAGTGTATAGTDYTALASGTLTFAAGETARTLTVTVTGDGTDEPNETVVVTLSGPANAVLGTASGTGTITDDDATPTVALALSEPDASKPDTVNESGAGNSSTVTATLDGPSSADVILTVAATAGANAVAGDFMLSSAKTLTIAAGSTASTGAVTVTAVDDTKDAPDKSVTVTATVSGSSGVAAPPAVTLTITDDDGEPSLSIDSPSVAEGDSGSASLEFTVSLGAASGRQVTVGYADAGTGTASSGTDYTALASGTLTFAAGETAKTLTVTVTGDETSEPDETVVVTLSSPANAVLGTASGTGTITDDDGEPSLSIDSPRVGEGDNGSASLEFTVSLSAASGQQVTVDYADAGTGTATSGTDYTALASGTLTFAAGETAKTLTVSVTGDETSEPDETVVVTLSGPANAVLGTASGTGTITDDDATPAMGGPSADAGDEQTVVEGVVVTLDGSRCTGPSGQPSAMLSYAWVQTAGSPTVTLTGAGTVGPSFTAPQVATTTTLTFTLTVTTGGVSASDTVRVTVTDDPPRRVDSTPSFGDAAIADKRWKQSTAVTAFTLPTASDGDGALAYTLSPQLPDGISRDAGHRISGTPSEPMVRTQYTWTATDADGDEATLAFSITVIEDLIPEFTETVSDQLYWVGTAIDALALPAASGGNGALSHALSPALPEGLAFDADTRMVTGTPVEVMAETAYTLTATDADGDVAMLSFRVEVAVPVTMSMEDAQAEEGEAVVFMVELSPPPPRPMYVKCVMMPGTATVHDDYVHMEEHRLGIAAGQHSVRVAVATIDDGEVEPEETFTVRLVPELAVVERVEATGTILDNDAAAARARALKVMLASFGREVAQEAVEVVEERLGEGASGSHVTLGGQRMPLGSVSAAVGEEALSGGFDREASHRREVDKRPSVSVREIVSDSAFALSFGVPEEAGSGARDRWTVWGRTGWSEFSGRPEGELSAQGKVFSGYVGLDARVRDDLMLGVALSHSEGDMSYERSEAGGAVDARLTSVLPYGRWTAGGGLSVWGLAGAGWGEVELVDDLGATRTGIGMGLLALGWRQELEAWQEVEWALKGDGFVVEVDSEAAWMLPATRAGVQRLRLMLESGTEWSVAEHGRLRTQVEFGGRWDGGDAQRGYGSEVGGSLEYVDSRLGVGIEGRGRYLLGHESQGFRAWGASLGVRVDPGGDGEGVWMGLSPVWGAPHSGVQSLWGSGPEGGGSKASSSVRMALEAGYRSGDALDVSVTVDSGEGGGASSPVGITFRTRLRW